MPCDHETMKLLGLTVVVGCLLLVAIFGSTPPTC